MGYWLEKIRTASFSLQVMLLFVLPFTITFVLAFLLMVEMFGDETTGNYVQQGKFISNVLAKQSALSILYGSNEEAEGIGGPMLGLPLIDQVAIFERDGTLLYQKGEAQAWQEVYSQAEIAHELKLGKLEYQNAQYWQFLTPVILSNSPDVFGEGGTEESGEVIGYVRVLMSKAELIRVKRNFISNALLFSVLAALVFVVVVRRLTRQLTGPLKVLSVAMSGVGEKKAKFELQEHVAKEIGHIGEAYNEMMGVLEQRERELEFARDAAIGYAQAKSQFAANVSHEIRSPLNGILGTLNLLACMDPPEEQLEYIQLAQESGEQLIYLINDILDYSKMSARQMPVESVEIDLQLILEDIITLQSGTPQAEGIELVCLFESNVPPRVLGDGSRFRQLFHNLVSNAVKFTESGEVRIQAYLAKESLHTVEIQFSVIDSGIGISPKDQAGIFDPYSQKRTGNGRRYDGTGLGLAICKQIVELLAGNISVQSELGKGSEFCVRLPFKKAAVPEPSLGATVEAAKLRILIVAPPGAQALLLENFCKRHQLHYSWTPNPYSVLDTLSMKAGDRYLRSTDFLSDTVETWVFLSWPQTLERLLDQLKERKDRQRIMPCKFVSFQRQTLGGYDEQHGLFDAYINKPVRRGALENLFDPLLSPLLQSLILKGGVDGLNGPKEAVIKDSVGKGEGVKGSLVEDKSAEQSHGVSPGSGAVEVEFTADSNLQASQFCGANVLVVEDNLINQRVALATLNILGLNVDVVEDGKVALKAVEKKQYALILMDCQMPVMNGYEATRRIRKLGVNYSRTPIVAWTANVTPVERQRCLDCGMDDFLAKPFKREQLVDILGRWLNE